MDASQVRNAIADTVAHVGYSKFLTALIKQMESDESYAKGGGFDQTPAEERIWRGKLRKAIAHVRAAKKAAGDLF